MTLRTARIHFAVQGAQRHMVSACQGSSFDRLVTYEPAVTCLRCLYWLGRYVPLGKLREHQAAQRARLNI